MARPCFLVLDPEYGSSISTRKLVIETAKMNVITSYSGRELLETLDLFPRVSGIVLNASVRDISCTELVRLIKRQHPEMPTVVVGGPGAPMCETGDHVLDTYDPARLLELLKSVVPQAAAALERREDELSNHPADPPA